MVTPAAWGHFLLGYGMFAIFVAYIFNYAGYFDPCAAEQPAGPRLLATGVAWYVLLLAVGAGISWLLYQGDRPRSGWQRLGLAWTATASALIVSFVAGGLVILPISRGFFPPLSPLLIMAGVLGLVLSPGALLPHLLIELRRAR